LRRETVGFSGNVRMAGEDGSSQEEVQTLETERVDKDQIMDDADEGNKFVVVVNAKENRPMHNALVNVLDMENKAVVQQFLVSRNKNNQLLLRELPGLVRGVVFTTASVIQHHQNKSKLIFLFTSKRGDLQGRYLFRITADGSYVDSELVPTSLNAVNAMLGRKSNQENHQPVQAVGGASIPSAEPTEA